MPSSPVTGFSSGRDEYPDFDIYCKVRWGFGKSQHYRLIEGAKVVKAISPNGESVPATEGQARELTPLLKKPNVLVEAWTEAVGETFAMPASEGVGKKVTAALHHQRRCAT